MTEQTPVETYFDAVAEAVRIIVDTGMADIDPEMTVSGHLLHMSIALRALSYRHFHQEMADRYAAAGVVPPK